MRILLTGYFLWRSLKTSASFCPLKNPDSRANFPLERNNLIFILFFNSLTLKPSYDRDNTVLCTPSKTYLLRNVTQTNSLLLFQKENDGFSLLKDAKSYLEIVSTPVRINLTHLAYVYDGYNLDVPDTAQLYTPFQVKRRIPASDEEIENAFVHSMCLFINGIPLRVLMLLEFDLSDCFKGI